MKVNFCLMVVRKDGETFMQKEADVPFFPRRGDYFTFCGVDCCHPGLTIASDGDVVWDVSAGEGEAHLSSDDSAHGTLEEAVAHYAECGFVEDPRSREMYEAVA